MAVVYGDCPLFGVGEPKMPNGFPDGKIRLRIRKNDFVRAYVKSADGIREFYVKEEGGCWVPGGELGANIRIDR